MEGRGQGRGGGRPESPGQGAGLDKEHEVTRINPETGEEETQTVTQRQYRDEKMEEQGWSKTEEEAEDEEEVEDEGDL
jgi:hypothetical protein